MANVYWIEDEPILLDDLPGEFEERGHHVRNMQSAQEAMEALDDLNSQPGPIVLDLFLPGANINERYVRGHEVGLELLVWLKANVENLDVIVLSGNIDLAVLERFEKEFGLTTDLVFDKPLNRDFDRLVNTVHEHAQRFDTGAIS